MHMQIFPKREKGNITNSLILLRRLIKSTLVMYSHKQLTSEVIEIISEELCDLINDQLKEKAP